MIKAPEAIFGTAREKRSLVFHFTCPRKTGDKVCDLDAALCTGHSGSQPDIPGKEGGSPFLRWEHQRPAWVSWKSLNSKHSSGIPSVIVRLDMFIISTETIVSRSIYMVIIIWLTLFHCFLSIPMSLPLHSHKHKAVCTYLPISYLYLHLYLPTYLSSLKYRCHCVCLSTHFLLYTFIHIQGNRKQAII